MSDPRELLRRLKKASNKLKMAATWNGTLLSVDSRKDYYVYELLCYFNVAMAAKNGFKITVNGNTPKVKGKLVARWPKGHANKKNFSYLKLDPSSRSGSSYQLCPGINIEDIHGKKRAPDINLLSGSAPDDPKHQNLLACWDAKYTSGGGGLPDTAVSDFVFTFEQLGKPKTPVDWKNNILEQQYKCSGLFTNGDRSTEPDETLSARGVAETYKFPESPVTRP